MHKLSSKTTETPYLVMLGIYPWNYKEISDTVRSMVPYVSYHHLIFLNPFSLSRRIDLQWQLSMHDGIEVWDPPFSFLPTRYGFDRIKTALKKRSLEDRLTQAIGHNWRDITFFYVTPSTLEQSYEYICYLKPKHVIFDILDDNLNFPSVSNKKRKLLKEKFLFIANRACLQTAVSNYLVEQSVQWTKKEVNYLPNGVDIFHFKNHNLKDKEPEDLKPIQGPRITFVGAITAWIDLELILYSALNLPDYQFVMIGPIQIDSIHQNVLRKLQSMKNVFFLGAKSFQDIPAYMHASDVLILPRTMDPFSLACDPIKIYEYLATGKAIVSTAHPSVERFSDEIWIAHNQQEFVFSIRLAYEKNRDFKVSSEDKILELTWEARANKLEKMLQSLNQ